MSQYGEHVIAMACLENRGMEPVVKESEHRLQLKKIRKDIF